MSLKLAHYQTAIENLHDAIMICQCKGGYPLMYINENFTNMTGYTLDDIAEKSFDVLYSNPANLLDVSPEINTMQACMKERGSTSVTLKAYKKDGTEFHANVSLSQIKNDRGRTTHYLSIIRDVSIHVNLEKQLFAENEKLYNEKQALKLDNKYDALTGLLTRRALENEVRGLFAGAKRAKEHFTLFFISINEFNTLSATLDTHQLNECIKQFSTVLAHNLRRESDILLRYHESEFIICFTGQTIELSEIFAQKLADTVTNTAFLTEEKSDIPLTISIGVVSAIPSGNHEINEFILSADLAMHTARNQTNHEGAQKQNTISVAHKL